MQRRLTLLQSRSSVVVDAPLRDVWKVCRAWGRQPWMPLLPDGTPFDVSVQGSSAECEIGAIRCSKMGPNCQIFEQLVAIDDEHTVMKWKTVDHRDTISPFEDASFVDFQTTLSLRPITMGNRTFVEWEGSCYTEPEYAASVQETLDFWYSGGMSSLKSYAAHQMAKKRHPGQVQGRDSYAHRPQQPWTPSDIRGRTYREASPSFRPSSRNSQQHYRPTY